MTEKFRELTKVYSSKIFGGLNQGSSQSREYCTEAQYLFSTGHPYRQLGRSSYDIGGPFSTSKVEWGPMPGETTTYGGFYPNYDAYASTGVLVPARLELDMRKGRSGSLAAIQSWGPPKPSDNDLIARGTTAISRVAPTSPVWDGATAVAELFSGVPKLPGKTGGNIGSEYLNVEFGILPTISDIRAATDAARRSEEIIAQLERDSGKWIRRTADLGSETLSEFTTDLGWGYPVFLGGGQPTAYELRPGSSAMHSVTTRSYKFSGAFTYHLPPKGSWRRKIAELDAVYGVSPGIDTAWNAVPFSWLADWHANMGDVLKNFTMFAQDGLVMPYGYITCRTERLITYNWEYGASYKSDVFPRRSGSAQVSISETYRMPASPFGFGVKETSYSPRQVAILAALGFSLK